MVVMTRRKTLFTSVNLTRDTLTHAPAIRAHRARDPDEKIQWMVQDDSLRPLAELIPRDRSHYYSPDHTNIPLLARASPQYLGSNGDWSTEIPGRREG